MSDGQPREVAQEPPNTAAKRRQAQAVLDEIVSEQGGGPADDDATRAERDLTIFRMAMKGVDRWDIAAMYGLTANTVGEIVRRQRQESQRLSRMDPLEIVEELTMQLDAGIGELAAEASRNKGSVRVSAIKQRIDALLAKGKWLQSSGILPQTATETRLIIDTNKAMEQVLTLLDERQLLDEPLLNEIHKALGKGEIIDADAEEIA